jgi:hypothetical protein
MIPLKTPVFKHEKSRASWSKTRLEHTEDAMRTPLSFLAVVMTAALLSACQANAPGPPPDNPHHGDPTAPTNSLAISPRMGGSMGGSMGASSGAGTAYGAPACMHGNQECSTDHQCCSGRCVQAGSATGLCEK